MLFVARNKIYRELGGCTLHLLHELDLGAKSGPLKYMSASSTAGESLSPVPTGSDLDNFVSAVLCIFECDMQLGSEL